MDGQFVRVPLLVGYVLPAINRSMLKPSPLRATSNETSLPERELEGGLRWLYPALSEDDVAEFLEVRLSNFTRRIATQTKLRSPRCTQQNTLTPSPNDSVRQLESPCSSVQWVSNLISVVYSHSRRSSVAFWVEPLIRQTLMFGLTVMTSPIRFSAAQS